ncbi:MAG: hypothetical protein KKE79_02415 [Actinobacteria bacterium]|nr:hypothetical protein [Actinomycetota bacterium]MBU4489469.1 hypothetical protein [Actinomycetota bacterium]
MAKNKAFNCPKCGLVSWGDMGYCPECGTPWTIVCGDCGASWRFYWEYAFCPACGSGNLIDITVARQKRMEEKEKGKLGYAGIRKGGVDV